MTSKSEKYIPSEAVSVELARVYGATCLVIFIYWVPLSLFSNNYLVSLTTVAFVVAVLVTLSLCLVSIKTALQLPVLAVLFQNPLLGALHGSSGTIPSPITETKTVIAVTICLYLILRRRWSQKQFVIVCIFSLYLLVIFSKTTLIDHSAIANGRNFIVPVLLIMCLIYFSPVRGKGWAFYSQFSVCAFAVLAAAGSVAEVAMGRDRWLNLVNAESLPGLNALSETTTFFGLQLQRAGGFFVEPINAGYAASFIIIYSLFSLIGNSQSSYYRVYTGANTPIALTTVGAAFLVIGLAATKNSLLIVVVTVIAYFTVIVTKSPILSFAVSITTGAALVLSYTTSIKGVAYLSLLVTDPVATAGGESTSFHTAGLVSGLKSLSSSPLGHGLGSGGNFFRLFNPEATIFDWLGTGGESAIGTLAYQLGLPGLILFFILAGLCARELSPASLAILSAFVCASLFAESILGPNVAVIAVMIIFLRSATDYPTSKVSERRSSTGENHPTGGQGSEVLAI